MNHNIMHSFRQYDASLAFLALFPAILLPIPIFGERFFFLLMGPYRFFQSYEFLTKFASRVMFLYLKLSQVIPQVIFIYLTFLHFVVSQVFDEAIRAVLSPKPKPKKKKTCALLWCRSLPLFSHAIVSPSLHAITIFPLSSTPLPH